MESAQPAPPDEVVFIADDDEDLLVEDEWQVEGTTAADMHLHAGQIQLQLRMCFGAAMLLPILAILIAMVWRRYADVIRTTSAKDLPVEPSIAEQPSNGKKKKL